MIRDSIPAPTAEALDGLSQAEFLGYFLKLGALGFGAPSHSQVICRRTWLRTGSGFQVRITLRGLAFSHLSPGPLAAQAECCRTNTLLIADQGSFKDLEISVKFKAVEGEVDRAGGLVFRLKDANNYYIVRADALEDNYRLYRVINGSRRQFAGANFKVASGECHELRVEALGNKFICYYDGAKKIEATDDTFKEAGKIGLWTKADSVTYFDDLRATAE